MSAEILREAAAEMVSKSNADNEDFYIALANFLDFAAAFADQPQPYSPTVDHALIIARGYLA